MENAIIKFSLYIASITGLFVLFLGYLIAFKHKYKLISGYQFRKDHERFPIEIEKKYCRHIGVPVMTMGLLTTTFIFLYNTIPHFVKIYIVALLLLTICILIVPSYVVKKEFEKLKEKEEQQ